MLGEQKEKYRKDGRRRWRGVLVLGFALGALSPWPVAILGAKLIGVPPYSIQIVVPDIDAAAPARVRDIRLDDRSLFVRYRKEGLWISVPTYAYRTDPTLHVEFANADGSTKTHALPISLPMGWTTCVARLDVVGGAPKLAPCEAPFLISSLRAFLNI